MVKEEQTKLAELVAEREKLDKQRWSEWERSRGENVSSADKLLFSAKAKSTASKVEQIDKKVRAQGNIVKAIENGGDISTITDETGVVHERLANFTKVSSENIDYDIETILTAEKPIFIPDINEEEFRKGSFILDIVKAGGEDKYLVATNKYKEFSENKVGYNIEKGDYSPDDGGFVVLTLDQLVLTQDYYVTKQKAIYRKQADEKNQRQIDYWNGFSEERKLTYYSQKNFYESMPIKAKKSISKEDWLKLSVEEKDKIYIPVKRYNPEKIKSNFDEKHMASSFHSMYERFVNPDAKRTDGSGKELKRGERPYGKSYASREAFDSWTNFRETLDWKINDINIQREEMTTNRSKAVETSYGESGTKNDLLSEYGIKVKRQNGDDIQPKEIEQIENAWKNVKKTFGELRDKAEKDNLKISHAGKTHMFASKAIGIYIPSKKTIGVTAKLGENQLGFTMGHEVAHWIDNTIGKSQGKRFASDNYESTAGKIATIFRKKMNKQSDSKYLNATHEVFARAMEMHHAINTEGVTALRGEKPYVVADAYVSLDTYEKELKPLIEQFLDENKDILKSMQNTLFN
jgi:hypothetical protein